MNRILTWLTATILVPLLYGCACLFILAIGVYYSQRFSSNHTPAPKSVGEEVRRQRDQEEIVWVWNTYLINDFVKKNRTARSKLKGAASPCVLPIEQVRQLEEEEAEAYEKEKRKIEALSLSAAPAAAHKQVLKQVPRDDWAWDPYLSEDFAKKYKTAQSKVKCAVSPSVLPIEQVVGNAQNYAHKLITIHGCYFEGEEYEVVVPCGDRWPYGTEGITMVGLFDTGGGFGHLGAYQHQFVIVDVVESKPFMADLSRADLRGVDLSETNLSGLDLRGADLHEANLFRADLHEANLRGLDLSRADLRGASLFRTDLRGADLRGTDLRGADLSWVHLSGADFLGADLSDANLCSTDLSNVKNLTQEQIDKSRGDSTTKLPANLHIPEGWKK